MTVLSKATTRLIFISMGRGQVGEMDIFREQILASDERSPLMELPNRMSIVGNGV